MSASPRFAALFALIAAVSAISFASAASAASALTVEDAVSTQGDDVAAVYFTIAGGEQADALVEITVDGSDAMMHKTEIRDGRSIMTHLDRVPIGKNEAVVFAPGGLHVMLERLEQPLTVGQSFEMRLEFERADPMTVPVTVVSDDDIATRAEAPAPAQDSGSNGWLFGATMVVVAVAAVMTLRFFGSRARLARAS